MTDKKLSRSMEILEVVIQMITFYSAFMAVYFGALQKPVSQLWKSLIIFVFVAAAYYSRRKIKLFKPFIVLHIAIIAAAFFYGEQPSGAVFILFNCGTDCGVFDSFKNNYTAKE